MRHWKLCRASWAFHTKVQELHKKVLEPRKMVKGPHKRVKEPHSLGLECHNLTMGLHMMSWEIRMMLREPCTIHLGEWALNWVYKRTLAWASFGVSASNEVWKGACSEVWVCKQVLAYKTAFWVCRQA